MPALILPFLRLSIVCGGYGEDGMLVPQISLRRTVSPDHGSLVGPLLAGVLVASLTVWGLAIWKMVDAVN